MQDLHYVFYHKNIKSLSLIQNLYLVYDFVILYTGCKLYAAFCNVFVLFIQV